MADEPLNIVLFSGTEDRLQAAAVMASGAAALGRHVNIFLQYWALDAFRRERLQASLGLAPEAGERGAALVAQAAAAGQQPWHATLRVAKELGEIDIQACSLSMDVLRIEEEDLDDLVDGVEGVTSFFVNAGDGTILFI
ncbi:MAG: DsrE/DsrF/DrsH-like family protein [Chloroflexi bacterium]|jgi:peroxiredoxin family protein|nr:DsrE/DsrF/DrsH-like family protein [Chloroflexota bacterium]